MKFIKNYWREGLLVLLLSVAATLIYQWTVDRPSDTVTQSFMLIGIVVCLAGAVWLVKSLWRDKWRQAATKGMQRLFAKVQRFFERFAEKLGFNRSKKSILGGKTRVIFDRVQSREEIETVKAAKPPKWKHLESERERMRYLYRQMIAGKLKKGALIYAADTPSEIEKKQEKTPTEGELFELYIGYRYDERKCPDAEEIKRLKKELEIK